jgi:hypothetical protein
MPNFRVMACVCADIHTHILSSLYYRLLNFEAAFLLDLLYCIWNRFFKLMQFQAFFLLISFPKGFYFKAKKCGLNKPNFSLMFQL